MTRTIYDPIVADVSSEKREHAQEEFGRHLIEQRNRMALLVRKWIQTDAKFPVPLYDRLIDRIRKMDTASRSDVASIALLMADQIISAILIAFDLGDEMQTGERLVNYAIVAQIREPNSDEVIEEVDVNRGEPIAAVWKTYNRWLSRYAPAELRPCTKAVSIDENVNENSISEDA